MQNALLKGAKSSFEGVETSTEGEGVSNVTSEGVKSSVSGDESSVGRMMNLPLDKVERSTGVLNIPLETSFKRVEITHLGVRET